MLNCFVPGSQGLDRLDPPPADIPEACVWVDLLEPTLAEERAVERLLAIDVPSREEMREIETSSRLYEENGALYMTTTVVAKIDTERPESAAITFILSHNRLITNRYVDPLPFRRFVAYSERHPSAATNAPAILAGLLESIIERTADVLERVGAGLDDLSANVFAAPAGKGAKGATTARDLRGVMERIGRDGDLTSKARESLVTLARQLTFIQQSTAIQLPKELASRYRSMSRDVLALSDHASFLANKSSFMLQATLGLISIEQNNIIKIFSVAAAVFLPPTLIASMYGMNFRFMPELDWPFGYPFALILMLVSALLPYVFFRRRGWL
jgi:magnesium transporter